MLNWISRIVQRESGPLEVQGEDSKFGFQKHVPEIMEQSHWHGHIEVNYLFGCSASYLINGKRINVPEGKMIIFWASIPHQMTHYDGDGYMVNLYIPLQAFLTWKLPNQYIKSLLDGEVLVSESLYESDQLLTDVWEKDLEKDNADLTFQVISEIRNRISRMAIESYTSFQLTDESELVDNKKVVCGINHVQTMLAYIADNFDTRIKISNVTDSTGLHKNYAMKLFTRVMKVSIKQYINQLRLHHAQALLVDTDDTVVCIANKAGFGSVSRFYDIFKRELNISPVEFRNSINNA
ncbi:helix-turn-helix domain-containing protein [Litorilituus lipolyticus]|uniref:Helix-turn-helix domain-containing protein n=1 Tax=Litorilituus lipolyticus TaxID=2491017 RepID=A0A502KY82_9GAMM|nr:helix-turn-helix domain-containing protein [Litorilituus lipolyticus]TPH14613.1 helix-turn-helix domain-containing protein [Litorilituus lipolyticus]